MYKAEGGAEMFTVAELRKQIGFACNRYVFMILMAAAIQLSGDLQ